VQEQGEEQQERKEEEKEAIHVCRMICMGWV
jgi:hypothetical protein